MDPRPLCSVLMPFGVKADTSRRAINFDRVYRDLVAPALRVRGWRCRGSRRR